MLYTKKIWLSKTRPVLKVFPDKAVLTNKLFVVPSEYLISLSSVVKNSFDCALKTVGVTVAAVNVPMVEVVAQEAAEQEVKALVLVKK